ncbi:MAG: hypothetical protein M3Q85_02025, partial [Acidobacteriota bacterium]|nr:hypothetical protein [Acidobacteriota bacterium]
MIAWRRRVVDGRLGLRDGLCLRGSCQGRRRRWLRRDGLRGGSILTDGHVSAAGGRGHATGNEQRRENPGIH